MEDNLKIVELKKCSKKVNKDILKKCLSSGGIITSVFGLVWGTHEFLKTGDNRDIIPILLMAFWYINFLLFSRKDTKDLAEDLAKEEEIEAEIEAENRK